MANEIGVNNNIDNTVPVAVDNAASYAADPFTEITLPSKNDIVVAPSNSPVEIKRHVVNGIEYFHVKV